MGPVEIALTGSCCEFSEGYDRVTPDAVLTSGLGGTVGDRRFRSLCMAEFLPIRLRPHFEGGVDISLDLLICVDLCGPFGSSLICERRNKHTRLRSCAAIARYFLLGWVCKESSGSVLG